MRQIYLHLIREALDELSSLERQKTLWLSDGTEEWSSLAEAICQMYDDSGLGDALDSRSRVYGPDMDAKLEKLLTLLQSIDASRSPQEVIDDPKMNKVRRLAGELLKELPQ